MSPTSSYIHVKQQQTHRDEEKNIFINASITGCKITQKNVHENAKINKTTNGGLRLTHPSLLPCLHQPYRDRFGDRGYQGRDGEC